jgi:hypothetical protein
MRMTSAAADGTVLVTATTVSSWLKRCMRPPQREPPAGRVAVIDERWAAQIGEFLRANEELSATLMDGLR